MAVRPAFVVAIVAVVAATAGCSSDDSSRPHGAATTTSTVAPTSTSKPSIASTLAPGDRYVALGSSIASGFGIPVQSTDCGRSDRDYGQLIARRFHLALTDVSCGAATIPNLLDSPQHSHPPQISAVTKDTKLITVTVGGNDIGYNGKALACGDPANVCTASPTLDADLAKTRTGLEKMLRALHAAASSAVLVFVTYPREVPDGNCSALGYADAESAVVREMGARLEHVFVDVFKNTDVVFVDPYVEPGDHTGCAPEAERWTAGRVAPSGFPYHPTALGHEVMARMIVEALTN